ncbi:MAG: DUF6390 family protein, partial [Patescibacteria group bacterium]
EKIKLIVQYQPLIGVKNIKFGRAIAKEVIWDKTLIPNLKIGDWVSIHWGYAIQKLLTSDVNNLRKYTQNTINSLSS